GWRCRLTQLSVGYAQCAASIDTVRATRTQVRATSAVVVAAGGTGTDRASDDPELASAIVGAIREGAGGGRRAGRKA
ncbi:hypothetical protein OEZ74_25770, partial [Leclercia adecarboxylata]|uniref:hypothetical protein n=1 Tax=Leclercia adecarboxylata TaxID=83655 RepID=UPI00234E0441